MPFAGGAGDGSIARSPQPANVAPPQLERRLNRLEPRNQAKFAPPQLDLLDGAEPSLLKFDGIAMTKDRENSPLRSILW
jgi:hypothetical protein